MRRTDPAPLSLVPGPGLRARPYKRILLLPPEQGVKVSPLVESQIPAQKELNYYVSGLEKVLLAKGFEVVSSEIVARAKTSTPASSSSAERALAMGKETQADAVLTVQQLSVNDSEKFIHSRDLREVAPADRAQDDDGRYFHRETEACLYRLPLYEVRIAAKLIDVQNGDVLWVGEGSEKSLDVLPKSWVARLDKECQVEEQVPYNYRDYLASEESFDSTVTELFMRLLEPLRERALSARPLPPPPPPPPIDRRAEPVTPTPATAPLPPLPRADAAVPVQAKKPMAVVTGGRALLRDSPQPDGLKVSTVPRDTRVEVLLSSTGWHKIQLEDGSVGWMRDEDLRLEP